MRLGRGRDPTTSRGYLLDMVYRCATCGGPLEETDQKVLVRCLYCQCENRLIEVEHERALARSSRLLAAAAQAQLMGAELEARGAELLAAFERESAQARINGDPRAAHAALQHLEGFLRLQYAPTLHMYRSMDPDDPVVVAALAQIDRVIDEAMGTAAASLGIPYRTTRERLGEPA
jgi:predicted  nucleic acid-binding Zn-ribbon protein